MKNEPSNSDQSETNEREQIIFEAKSLSLEILNEFKRINKDEGFVNWGKALMPESVYADIQVDKKTLYDTVAYHILIGSTPPSSCSKIDLPGDQNLIAYAKRKLEELKQM